MKTIQLSIIVILLLLIININMIFAQVKQSNVLSPLKQLKLGVSVENISCNYGFHLLTKSSDHSPACVKTTSIKRLVAQEWIIVPELNKSFSQNNTVSNKVLDTRNKDQTLGIIVVTYFDPTSKDWDLIYNLADNYSSTVRYVIINPCNGPCDTPLSSDWQSIISNLKARGI